MVEIKLVDGKFLAGTSTSGATGLAKKLVELVTENTRENFTMIEQDGKLEFKKSSIPNLGDWKRTLYNLPNNPFSLHNPASHTNSFIHQYLRRLSTKQVKVDNNQVKINAKRVERLVIYWNPQEARQAISEESNKEAKKLLQHKFDSINKLEDAYPL